MSDHDLFRNRWDRFADFFACCGWRRSDHDWDRCQCNCHEQEQR